MRFLFSFLFSFILPLTAFAGTGVLVKAFNKKIYQKPEWKALLHYNGEDSYIKDKSFILSSGNFSLQNELKKTITLILASANSASPAVCRFPGRWLFISKETGVDVDVGLEKCSGFTNYLFLFQGDTVYLGYVSKDVTKPTSMMGHLFIEAKGKGDYAISFLALVDSSNPLRLGWESLVAGIDAGFFLESFNSQLESYLWYKGRSVWRYRLNLSEYQKNLLLYHVYELKNAKLTYNYISYNCATVVYYILSLVSPSLLDEKPLIVTPLKVVKSIADKGVLSDEEFFQDAESVMESLRQKDRSRVLSELYYCYDLRQKNVKDDDCSMKLKEFSPKRSLIYAPFENHFSMGLVRDFDNKNFLYLRFFPVSNEIFDDNRYSPGEESVKFGEIEIGLSPWNLRVYKFGLYEMSSLKEFSVSIPRFSKTAFIGLKRYFNDDFSSFLSFTLAGGAGVSIKPFDGVLVYVLVNQEIGIGGKGFSLLFGPSSGAVFYPFKNGKMVFFLKRDIILLGLNNSPMWKLSVSQSFFINKHLNIDFKFERILDGSFGANRFIADFVFLF